MTKQEEIREDTARTFYEASDVSKTIAWLDLPKETKGSFFYKADNLLYRLRDLYGVVIKVDRELPNCLRCGNTGIVTEFRWIGPTGGNLDGRTGDRTRKQQYPCPDCEKSKVKAGYVAVEPLIGVK